jgi:4-hydroxy-tetrahydrodipicolinate synthase
MTHRIFTGSITALVTPFDNDSVDEDAFERLVRRQIDAGTHALVPCGTTGESATLTHDEHRRVTELCVRIAAGRVPVIAGAGSNATHEAVDLLRHAKAVGAHAALVTTPYYNRPNQAGMQGHYLALAEAVQLPIFLYNVPSRSAVDLLPETVGQLAAHPNIVGIKDATGDMGRVARHRALAGEQFIQLSGDDASALGFNAHGGQGCISVTSNIAPGPCAHLQQACLRGDFATARGLNQRLADLHRLLFAEPSPAPTKHLLSRLGLCRPDVRLPLVPLVAATAALLDAALDALQPGDLT